MEERINIWFLLASLILFCSGISFTEEWYIGGLFATSLIFMGFAYNFPIEIKKRSEE